MHTLPFIHQTNTAGAESKIRPRTDPDVEKAGESSSFEPAMRDARSKNTSAQRNSSYSEQDTSEVVRQEHRQSRRDEDLAGAAMGAQSRGTEQVPSSSEGKNQPEVADNAAGHSGTEKHVKETTLTHAEVKELRKNLQNVQQLLEDNPSTKTITADLQAKLQALLGNNSIASSPDGKAMKGLEELGKTQVKQLQDLLASLKTALNHISDTDSNSLDMKSRITDLLAQMEQVMRRSEQGAQAQTGVSQLRQPEIVDGFVLRAEQDKNAFNSASKIDDPRFAALLNKSTEFSSLRERQGQNGSAKGDMFSVRMSGMNPQEQAQSLIQQARAEMATPDTGEKTLEGQTKVISGNASITGGSAGDIMGMKGLAESAAVKDNAAVDFSATQKGAGVGAGSNDPGIMTLKSGATLPTARVVDQTIQHLSLHARGDSSVVTVKLYPEELGELNIRMVMEGDQLKLQIQAQNQQVREILEQNFPRLRTAMENQGVTVEDFQVSLGDSRAEDHAGAQNDDDLSRQRQTEGGANSVSGINSEESEATDNSLRVISPGGLSVHV